MVEGRPNVDGIYDRSCPPPVFPAAHPPRDPGYPDGSGRPGGGEADGRHHHPLLVVGFTVFGVLTGSVF